MFEAGLCSAAGMKHNRGGGFLSWMRAGSRAQRWGWRRGAGSWEYCLGRVVLERLLGHSSKSVQGLVGWALSLEEISRMKIKSGHHPQQRDSSNHERGVIFQE